MNCTFSKIAVIALLVSGISVQAHAESEWKYPFKGSPYAVAHNNAATTLAHVKVARTTLKHSKHGQAN